jgi:hypothetical protein
MNIVRAVIACLGVLAFASGVHADPPPVSASEREEIARLMRTFFDATRDGDTNTLATVVPTEAEFARIFEAGTEPLIERHRRAIAQAFTELRTRFASGQFVAVHGLEARTELRIERCSNFAQRRSECITGPVIEWTANGTSHRMRVNRLVRVGGHWRVLAPRL